MEAAQLWFLKKMFGHIMSRVIGNITAKIRGRRNRKRQRNYTGCSEMVAWWNINNRRNPEHQRQIYGES